MSKRYTPNQLIPFELDRFDALLTTVSGAGPTRLLDSQMPTMFGEFFLRLLLREN